MNMLTIDPQTLAVKAAEELYGAAVEFVAACEALAPLAETLALAERRQRAAFSVAGLKDSGPPAREHAAEVALHALAPLTPHVPLVTCASAEYHREQLLTIPEPKEGTR